MKNRVLRPTMPFSQHPSCGSSPWNKHFVSCIWPRSVPVGYNPLFTLYYNLNFSFIHSYVCANSIMIKVQTLGWLKTDNPRASTSSSTEWDVLSVDLQWNVVFRSINGTKEREKEDVPKEEVGLNGRLDELLGGEVSPPQPNNRHLGKRVITLMSRFNWLLVIACRLFKGMRIWSKLIMIKGTHHVKSLDLESYFIT